VAQQSVRDIHEMAVLASLAFRSSYKKIPAPEADNPLKTELYTLYRSGPYLTGNTLRVRYKDQPVNAV
jgi:hypothetical protein